MIESRWAALYARLGFTPEQIAFYDTPMGVRNSEEWTGEQRTEWRRMDEAVFNALRASARGVERNISAEVIKDSMEPIKSMADGKYYDSKSQYYVSLKAHGTHIVEKGEQKGNGPLRGDYNVKKELKQALHQHGILN